MEFTPGPRSVKITRNGGLKFRVQIPMMMVVSENITYGSMELAAENPEFVKFWTDVEDECKKYADTTHTWNSNLQNGKFRIKIDDRTHVFDFDSKLKKSQESYMGERVTCLLDVKSVYKFKGMCGITCRVHQMKVHEKVCML
jgi:hypothetical protein